MHWSLVCLLVAVVVLSSCRSGDKTSLAAEGDKAMDIKVTSAAFVEGSSIPVKYTCDGANVSPPLVWNNVPTGAKTIALICDDPDAPMRVFVHWVLFNLPANVKSLDEDIPNDKTLAGGAVQGTNDAGRIGYMGPCPPGGIHRYFFKLYALDTTLDLSAGATKPQLLEAMRGHILAEGQLIGKYGKK